MGYERRGDARKTRRRIPKSSRWGSLECARGAEILRQTRRAVAVGLMCLDQSVDRAIGHPRPEHSPQKARAASAWGRLPVQSAKLCWICFLCVESSSLCACLEGEVICGMCMATNGNVA